MFTYGKELADKGHQIGHVFISADIPDEAWGKKISFIYNDTDYTSVRNLYSFNILPSTDKDKYIFEISPIPYFVSVMFVIFCFIIIIPLFFYKTKSRFKKQLIFLMIFCICTILWAMGYQKMIFLTYDNSIFTGDIEYISIFAVPPSFSIFMYLIGDGKLYRKIMKITAILSSMYFILSTILNYCTENYHYCRGLFVIHILILIGITIMFVHYGRTKDIVTYQEKNLRIGSIIFLIFISLDFVFYFLDFFGIIITEVLFVPFGLFMFLLIVFMSYFMDIVDFIMAAKDSERLQKMAYTDGMTGLSNKRACMDLIRNLSNEKKDYAIIFFDMNNLKKANDEYSHDVGDQLICICADAIASVFNEKWFCGRYGGDEFITCLQDSEISEKDIIKHLDILNEKIEELNKQHTLPIEISIAYGYALSSDYPEKTADEILSAADRNMYAKKTEMKKIHN